VRRYLLLAGLALGLLAGAATAGPCPWPAQSQHCHVRSGPGTNCATETCCRGAECEHVKSHPCTRCDFTCPECGETYRGRK